MRGRRVCRGFFVAYLMDFVDEPFRPSPADLRQSSWIMSKRLYQQSA